MISREVIAGVIFGILLSLAVYFSLSSIFGLPSIQGRIDSVKTTIDQIEIELGGIRDRAGRIIGQLEEVGNGIEAVRDRLASGASEIDSGIEILNGIESRN